MLDCGGGGGGGGGEKHNPHLVNAASYLALIHATNTTHTLFRDDKFNVFWVVKKGLD